MPLLSPEVLKTVTRAVARKYPAVKQVRPTVRRGERGTVRLIYRIRASTADGHTITQRVRVTVTPEGKILKMTLSH